MNIEIGKEYRVKFPFIASSYNTDWGDGGAIEDSWKPGTYFVETGYEEDAVADGEGFILLTVVDRYKPGRYPERTFYIRKWQDPDGKVFGKDCLHMTTTGNFKRMLKGYRHPYSLVDG